MNECSRYRLHQPYNNNKYPGHSFAVDLKDNDEIEKE